MGAGATHRRSRAAVHVRRMPGAEHDHQRPRRSAYAVDARGPRLHRLFRTAVGRELGAAFRAGLEKAREVTEVLDTSEEHAVMTRYGQKPWLVGALALLFVSALFTSAHAHHSFAMYDMTATKTMTGKL